MVARWMDQQDPGQHLAQFGSNTTLQKVLGLVPQWFVLLKPPWDGGVPSPSASPIAGGEEEEGGWDGGTAPLGFGVTHRDPRF